MYNRLYLEQSKLPLRLLPAISSERTFGLKGGSAINFFYRDMPRLSSAPKAATRPPAGDKTLLFEAAGQPSMRKKREILNPIENARE